MSVIEYVEAREIIDSRGNPTVKLMFFWKMVPWEGQQFHPGHPQVYTRQ